MNQTIKNVLSSSHTWAVVGIFVVAGVKAVLPELSGTLASLAQVILAGYAVYAHQTA